MLLGRKSTLLIIALLLFSLAVGPSRAVAAEGADGQNPGTVEVQVLESTAERVRLDLRVPRDLISDLVQVTVDGSGTSGSVGSAFLSVPGEPKLPVDGVLLGIPAGAVPRLELLEREEAVLQGQFWVPPVPERRAGAMPFDPELDGLQGAGSEPLELQSQEDPEIYLADAPFPASPVELAEVSTIRGQQVARLAFYPLRFNPVRGELIALSRLVVSIEFDYPGGAETLGQSTAAELEAFTGLLQDGVANYDTAQDWRVPPLPQAAQQAATPLAGSRFRVPVEQEGLYQLTYAAVKAALEAQGTSSGDVDPRTFQIYHRGVEVDIHVAGEGDGSFDPGDYILFYAERLRSKYTTRDVYWLVHSQARGQRMAQRNVAPSGTQPVPASFVATLRLEDGYWYVPGAPGADDLDRWLWGRVFPPRTSQVTRTFTLANLATGGGTAGLRAAFLGNLDLEQDPDHHVQILLNGNLVEDATWNGIEWHQTDVSFPNLHLQEGQNTLKIVGPNDLGSGVDLFFDDWYELDYWHSFVAEGDRLAFSGAGPGRWEYRISGYSTADVSAFDVTDPSHVVRLVGAVAEPDSGGTRLRIEDTSSAGSRYLALAKAQWQMPTDIVSVPPSNLRSGANRAGYLIITEAGFVSALQPLKDHRAAQGLEPKIITTQEIYDEFSHGILNPKAIRDFLRYAYASWSRAPEYVLLGGDGHTDFHGYRTQKPNLVPPYLAFVDPWMGEAAVDNRYVAVSGEDSFPDMIVGRLPFSDERQAATMVAKILGYEATSSPGQGRDRVVFVADNADKSGDFAALSDNLLETYVEPGYTAQRLYLAETCPYEDPAVTCRTRIKSAVDDGSLLVHYVGHAWETAWASEEVFNVDAVQGLSNGTALPVVLSMDCLDGYFASPFVNVMAETWLWVEGKGAIASWAPSGLGVATGHHQLSQGFLGELFLQGGRELGVATLAGKLRLWQTGGNRDLIDTYTLFGDPALRIPALDADLQVELKVEPDAPVFPGDLLSYTLSFRNSGPATAHGVVLTDLVPAALVNPAVTYASPEVVGQRPGAAFTWDIADLAPGDGGEIRFQARVAAGAVPGTIVNGAQITSAEPELAPVDNRASATTVVTNNPNSVDLRIQKSVEPTGAVRQGDMLTYILTFANAGPGTAHQIVLSDLIPQPLQNPTVISKSSNVVKQHDGVQFMWTIADLAPGESGEIRIRAQVDPAADDGIIVNDAEIATSSPDVNPGNNLVWVSTIVGNPRFHSYLPLVNRPSPPPPLNR